VRLRDGDGAKAGGFSRPLFPGEDGEFLVTRRAAHQGGRPRMFVAGGPDRGGVEEGGAAKAGKTSGGADLEPGRSWTGPICCGKVPAGNRQAFLARTGNGPGASRIPA